VNRKVEIIKVVDKGMTKLQAKEEVRVSAQKYIRCLVALATSPNYNPQINILTLRMRHRQN